MEVTCARMWHDDLKALVSGRTLLSRAAVDWALRRVALESTSISACARTLGCSWNALDRAVRAHGMRILSRSDPYARVTRIGVDEHVWRHGASGDRYVTVIVDLTPRADGAPARLLDMVPGRCTRVLFCFNVFSAGSSVFFRSVGGWFSPVSSSCSQ